MTTKNTAIERKLKANWPKRSPWPDTLWISWNDADQFWHGHRGDQTFSLGIDGGRDDWENVARAALLQCVGVDQVVAEEELDTDDDELTVRPLGIVQADDGKVTVWRCVR